MPSTELAVLPTERAASSVIGDIVSALSRWRVAVSYGWRHRRLLNLDALLPELGSQSRDFH